MATDLGEFDAEGRLLHHMYKILAENGALREQLEDLIKQRNELLTEMKQLIDVMTDDGR